MNIIDKYRTLNKKDQLILLLLFNTFLNLIIAIIKFVFAIIIPSLWFGVNAGFGFILAFTRFQTIKDYKKIRLLQSREEKDKAEYTNFLRNGILLILLGIMYFFVSSYMYYNGTNTTMHEYITYLVALLSFYSISSAIYGMIKYRKDKEPVIKAIKITNFANALTSIVLTQVVLLDTYDKNYNSSINGYTGMGVSLIIIFLGLYMILGIKKYIK